MNSLSQLTASIAWGAWLGCLPCLGAEGATGTNVVFRVLDGATERPVPCRIHLRDSGSQPVPARGLPFWRDHFVFDGEVRLSLRPGDYTYTIERGPEYHAIEGKLTARGDPQQLTHRLERISHLAEEGWWSGETHVHRPLEDIQLLMRAEDLHVATVITWWNNANLWDGRPLPTNARVSFDQDRHVHVLAGEDERGGGALLFFGLPQPLALAGSGREFPSSVKFLRQARQHPGAWIEMEKPFWWDVPIWLAEGGIDSVGIANNHLNRGGMLDNEAWGKARDREHYPPAWGNGLWTQDIYYHILNAGFRTPPGAGSASGVLPNPVGYNRVWVHLDGPLTWDGWWEGFRQGRVCVGNGPLLRVRANGQLPGHVFRNAGPLSVTIDGRLDSRDPIARVELVQDGRITPITLPHSFTTDRSGWFLVRAIAAVTNTFRFASTGPFHVEIAGAPQPVRRSSARFFLDWTRERKAAVAAAISDPTQQTEVLEPIRRAEVFWSERATASASTTTVTGRVVDAATGEPIPSRIYVQHEGGRWFHPIVREPGGSAIPYQRRNWLNTNAVEIHTTVSAHPFDLELPAGNYTVTVERGKEWRPLLYRLEISATNPSPQHLRLPLQRWVNMASRGWYSGDTHVHRTLAELPNVMFAEDLNVALPLTYWVTAGFAPPTRGDKNTDVEAEPRLIRIDDTHVIWPRNTEYEIFSLGDRRHTLGAVFVLNHRNPFDIGAPPVGPIAARARSEGALLDLDKHDWPWSIALVPVMGVDLYELANNHHWRTEFGITQWASPTPVPNWMQPPNGGSEGSEADWTRYTFETYYALLNCGYRLRPTAGCANGVHPVPLGFGRVYVHLPEGFSYDAWIRGLNAGHSFVTTGPMLLTTGTSNEVRGTLLSESPVDTIEVIINGELRHTIKPPPRPTPEGGFESEFSQPLRLEGTSWVAVRCWESRPDGRLRFAHTAPRWFDVPGRPLHARREQAEFLHQRVQDEINRSRDHLPPAALEEYNHALAELARHVASSRPTSVK